MRTARRAPDGACRAVPSFPSLEADQRLGCPHVDAPGGQGRRGVDVLLQIAHEERLETTPRGEDRYEPMFADEVELAVPGNR